MDVRFSDFAALLHANAPNPEHAGPLQLYGRFVGDWDSEIIAHDPDGAPHRARGEIHFGWILEGRAIQDVWIVPPRGELRHGDAAANVNSYGTTLRIYDVSIDAWQIQWSDPVTRNFLHMIGRGQGDDIVQLGTRPDGKLIRWSFSEITPNSFRWRGEISDDEGVSWRLNVEFLARRTA